jgi:hypothetical protein
MRSVTRAGGIFAGSLQLWDLLQIPYYSMIFFTDDHFHPLLNRGNPQLLVPFVECACCPKTAAEFRNFWFRKWDIPDSIWGLYIVTP